MKACILNLKASVLLPLVWVGILHCQAIPLLEWNQLEVRTEMKPDQSVAYLDFRVTNRDEETFRISEIETSAGNITVRTDRRILKPSQSCNIRAVFNKGKRTGKHRESLFVYLEGFEKPITTLNLYVHIPELVSTKPNLLYWGPEDKKTSKSVSLTIDARYIKDIETIRYDPLEFNLTQTSDPENPASFKLTIEPVNFAIPVRDIITVRALTHSGNPIETHIQVLVRTN